MLTLEEQESRAYISGDIARAALLTRVIEGDIELQLDLEMMEEQRNSAERKLEGAEALIRLLKIKLARP